MVGHSQRSTSGDAGAMNTLRQLNAAEEVFNTFEFVEAILLQLSLEDVLLMSNTSNFTRQVIEGSTPLTTRFNSRNDGYRKPFELRNGDSWSDNISFAFYRDFSNSIRMFASRAGNGSAVAVLSRYENRLKIANGRNMQVTFQRVRRFTWDVKVIDFESNQTFTDRMDMTAYPQDAEIILTWYMLRFHGEPRFTFEK